MHWGPTVLQVIFEMKNMSHVSFLCFPLQGLKPLKSQGIYEKVLSFLQQDQSSRIVLNSLECSYTLCLLGEFIGLVKNPKGRISYKKDGAAWQKFWEEFLRGAKILACLWAWLESFFPLKRHHWIFGVNETKLKISCHIFSVYYMYML